MQMYYKFCICNLWMSPFPCSKSIHNIIKLYNRAEGLFYFHFYFFLFDGLFISTTNHTVSLSKSRAAARQQDQLKIENIFSASCRDQCSNQCLPDMHYWRDTWQERMIKNVFLYLVHCCTIFI